MLYIFDLDGTLISPYMERQDRDYDAWHVLPGRSAFLRGLRHATPVQIAIATNQAGVAFGYISEQQVREKIAHAIRLLGLPVDTPFRVCFAHPKGRPPYNDPNECARRKPSGRMLVELYESLQWDASETVYIGDSPEDAAAAADAGVAFMLASHFFMETT